MICETLDKDCSRVADELSLVGLDVQVRAGTHETALSDTHETALSEQPADWDAMVLVRDDGHHIIWTQKSEPASAVEPVELQPAPGESRDSVALRSAELVRGELLPQNKSGAKEPSALVPAPFGPRPAFAFTTGPTLLVSSYGGVAPGWTGDISYWFDRFSLGIFATGALTPSPWVPADKEVNQQQLTAGLLTKGLLLRAQGDRFDLTLGGGVGARTQWLLGRRPPGPMDAPRFHGVAMAVAVSIQLEACYSFFPWLALGGSMGGSLGIPLSFPEPNDSLKKKATDALVQVNEQKSLDGLVQASVLITFRF